MSKSIPVNAKRRGRPATGQDPVSAVRLPADLTREIDGWARKNDAESRSEAIRRLVELGLKVKAQARPVSKPGRRLRAQELATKAIEKIIDPAAPPEERAQWLQRAIQRGMEAIGDSIPSPWGPRIEFVFREIGGFVWLQITLIVVLLRVMLSGIASAWRLLRRRDRP
jgi:Arc/MetJ-type ribon-helix-helix transcriptional regulator